MAQTSRYEMETLSMRIDGRASIEHQISIHVNDLFDAKDSPSADAHDISVNEVMAGIRYCMDYRIKGGKLPNLDFNVMKVSTY